MVVVAVDVVAWVTIGVKGSNANADVRGIDDKTGGL